MKASVTLGRDSPAVRHLTGEKRFARLFDMVGPLTYSPCGEDPFSFLAAEIIEQMLSVRAADRIYGRLRELCGGSVTPERISALAVEEIRSAGTSARKAAALRTLASAFLSGELSPEELAGLDDGEVTRRLTALRGIGSWTAKMYLIFVLDRPDVLPWEDGAFLQAYRWFFGTDDTAPASVRKNCSCWKPWSSVGARFLYRALDSGLTREEFRLQD